MANTDSSDHSSEEVPKAPSNDVPAAGDELGGVSFGFVVGGRPEDGIDLQDLGLTFENGQPPMDVGRRAFGSSITALHGALAGYSAELAKHEGNLSEMLANATTVPALLAASDLVHEALFSLKTGHHAYTGHPFPADPLTRDDQQQHGAEKHREDDFDPRNHEYEEDDSDGPIGRELGVIVPLNMLLQSGSGTMVQLSSARVHGNGVTLAVECAQLRGPHEDPAAWRLRGQAMAECELEVDDPVTGASYKCRLSGMDGRDFNRVNRCSVEFWMPGVLGARQLHCVLKVENFPSVHGEAPPLNLQFDLDPEVLRAAAARIHRP